MTLKRILAPIILALSFHADPAMAQARASTTNGTVITLRSIISGTLSLGTGTTIQLPDGTCAAPSFAYSSDTNTGVARIGTDQAALCAGGKTIAQWKYNTFNSNDSAGIYLGTGQAITDTVNDVYQSTLYPTSSVNTTGNTSPVFLAIGQNAYVLTDTTHRTRQQTNVEFDYATFTQSGGAVTIDSATNMRVRYPAVGASITLTDDIAIDVPVWPGALEVGTVTNHKVINFRDPGATAGNNYGLFFNTGYTADIATASGTNLTLAPGGTGGVYIVHDGIATTSTSGAKMINNTAATSGVPVQKSPSMAWTGTAYNSVSTLSEIDSWQAEAVPATAAGATGVSLAWSRSIAGAAATQLITFSSAGGITAASLNAGTGSVNGDTYTLHSRNLIFNNNPTISSGFGSGASIANANGTVAFTINVGTGGSESGVIGLPAAGSGWAVFCNDITTKSSTVAFTQQSATSTTTATIKNYTTAMATSSNWTDSDILQCHAFPY